MARRRPVESRMYALQVLGLVGEALRPVRIHELWIARGGMLLAATRR
jgi:hypothetical protein